MVTLLRLVLAGLVIGVAIGAGTALAHVATPWQMVQGNTVYGTISHSTTNDPFGFPDFSYDEDHVGWADADYPDATHFKLYDTGYWNGSSDDPDHVVFGIAHIWDEYGNQSVSDFSWYCTKVDGINEARDVDDSPWDYDGLGTVNNYVYWDHYIYKIPESSCLEVDDSVIHYSDWQSAPD
jgi:hypothetical protein